MRTTAALLTAIIGAAGAAVGAGVVVLISAEGRGSTSLCREIGAEVGLDFDNPYGPVTAREPLGVTMQRNMGNGAAVGDYDADGDLDVYLLSNAGHPSALFRNDLQDGEPAFTDVTDEAGVADEGLGRVAHFADLDGDADLDLLVLNDHDVAGRLPPSRLFRNDGDGTFTDVSEASGLQEVGFLVGGASLADVDGDLDLDLYVSMWTREIGRSPVDAEPAGSWPGSNTLFENRGDLRFVDVTTASGLEPLRLDSFTSVFHDFDRDDDLDMYLALDHRADRYYEQRAPGRFVDASDAALVNHEGNDMGIAVGDVSSDGRTDLFVTNVFDPAQSFGSDPPGNTLLLPEPRADGGVRFRDAAEGRGVLDVGWGWGAVFTDADLDGDLDLYAGQGFDEFIGPDFELHDRRSVLFLNDGRGSFAPEPSGDCALPGDQRALIAFDADRDHDADYLLTQVAGPPLLVENRTSGEGVTVVLAGPAGMSAGAEVTADLGGRSVTHVVLAGGSYLAGPPREAYVGTGGADEVDVTVRWADGSETAVGPVEAGSLVTVVP